MLGFSILPYLNIDFLKSYPWLIIPVLFMLWMLIDAMKRGEYVWALFIFLFPVINAILYYFLYYRNQPAADPQVRGFELPGTYDRRRIKELQGQIHHLDKAHHHLELGNIYFQQGKLDRAEQCYRAALERDGEDEDIQARLGQLLIRKNRPEEGLPYLEKVAMGNPKHDYGHTMMALAEAYTQLNRPQEALATWLKVLENYSYARAKVQLAELYLQLNRAGDAKKELEEVLADDSHAAKFQKKLDKVWVAKARKLLSEIG